MSEQSERRTERTERIEKIVDQFIPLSIGQDITLLRQLYQQINRDIYPLKSTINGGDFFTLRTEWQLGITSFEEFLQYIKAFVEHEELFSYFTYNKIREILEATDDSQISPNQRQALMNQAIEKMWRSIDRLDLPIIRLEVYLKYAGILNDTTLTDKIHPLVPLVIKALPTYDQFHKTWPPFWANFNDDQIRKINVDILYDEIFSLEEFFKIFDIIPLSKGTVYEPLVQEINDYVHGIYTSDAIQWEQMSPRVLGTTIRMLEHTNFEEDFIYAKAKALLNQVNRSIENHSGIKEAVSAYLHILRTLHEFDTAIDFWKTLTCDDDTKGDLAYESRFLKEYAMIHDHIDKIESLKDFFLEKARYRPSGRERPMWMGLRTWESDWFDAGLKVAYDYNKADIVSHPLMVNNLHHYDDHQLFWVIQVLVQMPETQEHLLPLVVTKINATLAQVNKKTFNLDYPRGLTHVLEATIKLKQAGLLA